MMGSRGLDRDDLGMLHTQAAKVKLGRLPKTRASRSTFGTKLLYRCIRTPASPTASQASSPPQPALCYHNNVSGQSGQAPITF